VDIQNLMILGMNFVDIENLMILGMFLCED
jgi:hypothetical protein